jgi:phospholipid/cholesterol/gamma-HCH transport system substrate-binding protein
METTRSENIKVGIFVLAGILIFAISIFTLGSNSNVFTPKLSLFAEFQHVQGLSEGSVVSLSGITIGNISQISFNAETNLIKVKMSIDRSFETKIRRGSTVEIRTQGALGDKYIYILPGPVGGSHVESGEYLAVAKSNDFMSVLADRASESEKIFDILNETYVLLKSVNKDNKVENILKNVQEATVELKSASVSASKMINDSKINQSIDKMDQILGRIDRGEGTLGALINDSSLHSQVKRILGGYERQNHIKKVLRTSIEKDAP